jgi:hypothetical protein
MMAKLFAAMIGIAAVVGANALLHVEMRHFYGIGHLNGYVDGYGPGYVSGHVDGYVVGYGVGNADGVVSGRQDGVKSAVAAMGDVLLMRDPQQDCIAVDPHAHVVIDTWVPRADGNCHLSDWRVLRAEIARR